MIILGDIHGNSRAASILASNHPEETILQVGDFGWGFDKHTDARLQALPENVKFIRGNHDNPHRCQEHPGYLGDFGFRSIDGLGVFYVGGADSIDKDLRTPGRDWWPEEQLSDEQLAAALAQFRVVAHEVDVIVTHDAPQDVVETAFQSISRSNGFGPIRPTRTRLALQVLHAIQPVSRWYFGHWHPYTTREFRSGTTSFTCLGIDDYRKVSHIL